MEQMENKFQEKFQVMEDEIQEMKKELEKTNKRMKQISLKKSPAPLIEPENSSNKVFIYY